MEFVFTVKVSQEFFSS